MICDSVSERKWKKLLEVVGEFGRVWSCVGVPQPSTRVVNVFGASGGNGHSRDRVALNLKRCECRCACK